LPDDPEFVDATGIFYSMNSLADVLSSGSSWQNQRKA
jgi:hypothetical protein